MSSGDMCIGIDRDIDNIDIAREKMKSDPALQESQSHGLPTIHLIHSSFADIDTILDEK
jgi:hypothetical protein